jgi:hypothetical protein
MGWDDLSISPVCSSQLNVSEDLWGPVSIYHMLIDPFFRGDEHSTREDG